MAEEPIKSPDTERQDRVPPGQKLTEGWPALHYGNVPKIDTSRWTFTIAGLVEKERKLSYAEFTSLPQVKVFSDIHCVTGWSKLDNLWEEQQKFKYTSRQIQLRNTQFSDNDYKSSS